MLNADPWPFAVEVGVERTDPAVFGLMVTAGELPWVRLHASAPASARELRDYLAEPSTRAAIADALFDALDELAGMDTLEDFERCR